VIDQDASSESPDPDREQIASHLYEHLRGHDNLVFANSRASVEEFADLLRRRSESERVPVEFFPHHGNLSKGLREEVEEHLRNPSSPTTAICTSTLELGIDVGSVTCVGQIDPAFSAAALRQRLGRSGRKPGDPSILRMYVTESELEPGASPHEELREGLVQSIALIEALIDGWVEPPLDDALHLSTLIQQVLSVIAQHGGARADQIWDALCGHGPFELARDAFVVLLRGLVEREVIDQVGDGDLHLAPAGESLVNHYSFFSAFMTAEEYRLVHEGREIGSMPVYSPLTEESFLIFAGRRWQVVGVEDERRVITVVRAKGGRVPRFIGGGGLIHDEIRRRMREIYESDRVPGFLDESARELLAEGRSAFAALGLGDRDLVAYESGSAYFPWRGDRVISTLALGARSAARHVEASGLALLAPHAKPDELHETLTEVFGRGPAPDPLALMDGVKNLETEKHHGMLDRGLLLQDAAIGRLDVEGAVQSVASLRAPAVSPEGSAAVAPPRPPEFVVVDCETTGLHPSAQHRIVELAMVVVDVEGNIVDSWSSLLQPDRDLGAGEIHGIRARELTEAPRFAQIAGEVTERLAGRTLVAHNARFDKAFLESELNRAGIEAPPIPYICTMELASHLQIGGTRRRLSDCRGELGLPPTHDHEALADAEACAEVLRRYLARNGEATLGLATGPLRAAEAWPTVDARAPSVQRQPAFSEPVEPGALSQLMAEAPPPAGHEGADASAYLEALERAIEDRHLDPAEREELAQTAQMLGIDSKQLTEINHAYVAQLVELAWRDGAVTEREREDLYLVSCALGVKDTAEQLRQPPPEPSGGEGSNDTKSDLQGKTVCFTGELLCSFEGQRMTRETASRLATAAGLEVLPRVTKKVDLLVLADPDSNSGKARKAKEYGTRLIAETAFWAMIGVEVS
jgi:ATP-dependent Lhr-like helicase